MVLFTSLTVSNIIITLLRDNGKFVGHAETPPEQEIERTSPKLPEQTTKIDLPNQIKKVDLLKKEGFLTHVYPNGDKYTGKYIKIIHRNLVNTIIVLGNYTNGKKNGKGKLEFADGRYFEGFFVDDDINAGLMVWPKGSSYKGAISRNKFNGEGELTEENGNKYIGYWVNDELDGKGIFKSFDGASYEGDFKMGKYDGEGVYREKNGTTYTVLSILLVIYC
jgi:hypothetical protein